jgi:hypothetical protein
MSELSAMASNNSNNSNSSNNSNNSNSNSNSSNNSNSSSHSKFYDKTQNPIHRWFNSPSEYVNELGCTKSFVITKILIANNGVGAVKCIRSIRKWSYEVFGNERCIKFIVMATPEDLRYVLRL